MSVSVIKAPAGCGKSTLFARQIANFSTGTAEVYVPTVELAVHWKHLILHFNPERRVQVVIGRNFDLGDSTTACDRPLAAKKISSWGLSVYSRLCKSPDGRLECPRYRQCRYIRQFDFGPDVYIYTHAHLPLDRGRLEQRKPRMVVIDESFFGSCLSEVRVSVSAVLQSQHLPPDAIGVVGDLAQTLQTGQSLRDVCRKYRRQSGGLTAMIARLDALGPAITPCINDTAIACSPFDYGLATRLQRVLRHLLSATRYQDAPQSITFDSATQEIVCQVLRPITRFKVGQYDISPDIFILDANASKPIIECFFKVDVFKETHIRRKAHVVQCWSTRGSTRSLVPSIQRNPNAQDRADAAKRLAQVQAKLDDMSSGGQKVLVVGPTAIVGNPGKNIPSLLSVPAHCDVAHFNALRGKDKWRDFDSALIVGRNQPPMEAIEKIASALFASETQPLHLLGGGRFPLEPRGYRMTDLTQIGVDVEVHPDPRVQALLEQYREGETQQAIDRLRLVHCKGVKRVVLLSNIPLDIDVDELLSWNELMCGSRLEQALHANGGVLPLEPSWLATHYPALWKTPGAAKKDVQRAFKKGHSSNRTSIGKMSLFAFKYKPPAQRNWSHCLSLRNAPKSVQKALRKLLGKPVVVQP